MKLPIEFLGKMKSLLGEDEYTEFLKSYDEPRHYGLRINTLKADINEFLRISPFSLDPVPWTRDGFYYNRGENPGRHPYYNAGLYYIQEPSAMLPGEVMDAKPGERILDLCAAPGGKTVQLAAGMKGEGLLVANDISSDRVKALVKNIELCGIRNALVTNDTPEKLSINFREFFDGILVDAPCSGEGMFRKDEDAARSWEKFKCEKCSGMQWDILRSVDKMLKPGGRIVYSTCTFSPEEDEIMISRFLEAYPDYEIGQVSKTGGIADGRPDWADNNAGLARTARLWPHRLKGEGHFVALLYKKGAASANGEELHNKKSDVDDKSLKCFNQFAGENLNMKVDGYFSTKGNNIYNLPVAPPDLSGIKVAKFGWYLGEITREKFEPSHSMVLALKKEDVIKIIDFKATDREIDSYLKGETLMIEGQKGLTCICVDGYTLGWAKQTGDMLKNLYPKGWRKMG